MTALPPELTHLKVIPSYACGRGCFYCYNTLLDQSLEIRGTAPQRALDEALAAVPRPITVEVIGGEPLEKPALRTTVELLERAQASPDCRSTVLSTAVATPTVLDPILPFVDLLYLSVDASTSERNRKRVSVARLAALVELCGRHGTELMLSTVLFGDETTADLDRFVGDLLDAGVASVGFTHLRSTTLSPQQVAAAAAQYHHLFQLRLTLRDRLEIAGGLLESIELHVMGGRRVAACECGRNSVVIEPDGSRSMGVCFDHESFRPQALDEFRDLKQQREDVLREGMCGTCPLWDVCHGGCASEAHHSAGGTLGRAEQWCATIRAVAALVDGDLQQMTERAVSPGADQSANATIVTGPGDTSRTDPSGSTATASRPSSSI
jgi:radical SAM protein with 4Fe4S-binding SPASM domain